MAPAIPETDPTELLRARDGVDADDLLIAAVAHLDLFSYLADRPRGQDELAEHFGLEQRPTDVLCTLVRSMGLIHAGELLRPTALARDHLVQGSPFDLGPYFASLGERPGCL